MRLASAEKNVGTSENVLNECAATLYANTLLNALRQNERQTQVVHKC